MSNRATADHRPQTADRPPDVATFRDTEIGPIPADWALARLGEITNCKGGYTFPPDYQGREEGQYPFYKVSDMNLPGNERVMGSANNYVSDSDLSVLRISLFSPGTVVFPKIGGAVLTNKKRILSCPALFDNNVMGIWVEDKERCIDNFLLYIFVNINLAELANVGTLPSITNTRVQSHLVSLPPLEEQRRIAAVLTAIQDAIAAQEDVIAAARTFKRSLMHRLFTYGPGREPSATKETEIGEIPAHWQIIDFEDVIVSLQNGLYKSAEFYGTGTPILRIDAYQPGETITNQPLKRLKLTEDELSRYALSQNDIILNRVNGNIELVGKAAIVSSLSEPTVFESNMIRATIDSEKVSSQYVLHFLCTPKMRNQIRQKARLVHQASVNQEDIKSLLFALPPKEEQSRIVDTVYAINDKIAAEEDRLSALQALFKSMLHQLMTGQIRLLGDEGLPVAATDD